MEGIKSELDLVLGSYEMSICRSIIKIFIAPLADIIKIEHKKAVIFRDIK